MLHSYDGETHDDPHETLIVEMSGRSVTVEIENHAVRRMYQRNTTVEDLLLCLRHPDLKNLPTDGGQNRKRVARHTPDGSRTLNVVYEQVDEHLICIITTYYSSGTRR